jgi:heme-degrading monooxygenase HmoA
MMNYIVVTVKPQTEAAYLKWVQGHVMPMTMAQPGYKGGGLFKDVMLPNTYVVVGEWESRAAMQAWMKAEHQLVLHADQSLIDPLRGNVHEEPHLFETKAVPFKP